MIIFVGFPRKLLTTLFIHSKIFCNTSCNLAWIWMLHPMISIACSRSIKYPVILEVAGNKYWGPILSSEFDGLSSSSFSFSFEMTRTWMMWDFYQRLAGLEDNSLNIQTWLTFQSSNLWFQPLSFKVRQEFFVASQNLQMTSWGQFLRMVYALAFHILPKTVYLTFLVCAPSTSIRPWTNISIKVIINYEKAFSLEYLVILAFLQVHLLHFGLNNKLAAFLRSKISMHYVSPFHFNKSLRQRCLEFHWVYNGS